MRWGFRITRSLIENFVMPSSCQFVLLCMSMEYTTYSAGCKELVISWATVTADFSHALLRSERLHSVSAFSYMTRTVHRWICPNERQFKYACKWTTNRIKENNYWQERNWFGITFSLASLTSKQLQNECHHRKAFSPIKADSFFLTTLVFPALILDQPHAHAGSSQSLTCLNHAWA